MSAEHDAGKSVDSQPHKKSKEHRGANSKTKRKRHADETIQSTERPPTKKHRASKSEDTSTVTATAGAGLDSAVHSPFHQESFSLYLPLSPICQAYPLEGLCAEHLSPLILTYYPPFKGVVLAYNNVQLSEQPQKLDRSAPNSAVLAKSIDEYAVSFVWLTADFLVFKPQRGEWIEGWVNLQSESHLGIVCWNLFNASIERKGLPNTWRWVAVGSKLKSKVKLKHSRGDSPAEEEDEEADVVLPSSQAVHEDDGHFEDAEGKRIEGPIRFRIKDVETSSSTEKEKSFLSIEGTLLTATEEEEIVRQERSTSHAVNGGRSVRPGQNDHKMSGALDEFGSQTGRLGDSAPKVEHGIKY
ncbi:hypothetical protein MMC34_003183 [Xylographa carneopallida]|nr:hypothetical protein [Xylographa carneopallida]